MRLLLQLSLSLLLLRLSPSLLLLLFDFCRAAKVNYATCTCQLAPHHTSTHVRSRRESKQKCGTTWRMLSFHQPFTRHSRTSVARTPIHVRIKSSSWRNCDFVLFYVNSTLCICMYIGLYALISMVNSLNNLQHLLNNWYQLLITFEFKTINYQLLPFNLLTYKTLFLKNRDL